MCHEAYQIKCTVESGKKQQQQREGRNNTMRNSSIHKFLFDDWWKTDQLEGQNRQDLRLYRIPDNKCRIRDFFKNHFETLYKIIDSGKPLTPTADRELGILLYQNEQYLGYFLVTRKKTHQLGNGDCHYQFSNSVVNQNRD